MWEPAHRRALAVLALCPAVCVTTAVGQALGITAFSRLPVDADFREQRPGAIVVWPLLRNHDQPGLCDLQVPERKVGELVGGAELEGHAALLVRAGPGSRAFGVVLQRFV